MVERALPHTVTGTIVVYAFLNARYYDGNHGQFISQDPVFLGDPSQQNLVDPQSLNAYSYSADNPITKSDPNGKFLGVDDAAELTSPLWLPAALAAGYVTYIALHNAAVNAISASRRFTDTWANSNSRQIQPMNVNSGDATGGGGNDQPPQPGWKTWGKVIGLVLSAGCELTNCLSWTPSNNNNSTPSISVGPSNVNNGGLYWTQAPSTNASAKSAGPSGPSSGRTTQGSNSGLSQQIIQSIQSEITSIQNQINQIRNEINSTLGGQK